MKTTLKTAATLRFILAIVTVAMMAAKLHAADGPAAPAAPTAAVAVVHPLGDSKVMGVVHFTQDGADKLKVVADITGLEPNSQHAFHIHEFGDCSDPEGKSAGGHYNPEGHQHGKPTDPADKRHPGDMGNLQADASGKAHLELTLEGLTIAGAQAPIIGRGIIIHAKPDDFSQPVGNAGGRIACGTIGVGKP